MIIKQAQAVLLTFRLMDPPYCHVRHFFLRPREGGVVTVTSRYTIKYRIPINNICTFRLMGFLPLDVCKISSGHGPFSRTVFCVRELSPRFVISSRKESAVSTLLRPTESSRTGVDAG